MIFFFFTYPWSSAVPASPQPIVVFFSLSLCTWISKGIPSVSFTYKIPVRLWRSWTLFLPSFQRAYLSLFSLSITPNLLATLLFSSKAGCPTTSFLFVRSRLEGGETKKGWEGVMEFEIVYYQQVLSFGSFFVVRDE